MNLGRLKKYPPIVNSQDLLKNLGILFITLDHVSAFFFYVPIFNVLGNMGAPLFFFLVGQHKPKRIFWEYLAAGSILTVVTYMTEGYWFGNILMSFFFIKLVLLKFPKVFESPWGIPLAIIPIFAQPLNFIYFGTTFFEYGGFGIAYSFSAFVRRQRQAIGSILGLIVLASHHAWMHVIPRNMYELPFDYETFSFTFMSAIEYVEVGLFYLVFVSMGLVIVFFSQRQFSIAEPIKWPILLISRYSLHIYALQLLVFELVAQ